MASITFGVVMASAPVEGTVHGTKGSIKIHSTMHNPTKLTVEVSGNASSFWLCLASPGSAWLQPVVRLLFTHPTMPVCMLKHVGLGISHGSPRAVVQANKWQHWFLWHLSLMLPMTLDSKTIRYDNHSFKDRSTHCFGKGLLQGSVLMSKPDF